MSHQNNIETTTPVNTTEDMSLPETDIQAIDSFDAMNLPVPLLRGIYAYGFEKPSAIQQKAIVPITTGVDVIGQAQSGTGKTGAFSIGSLARIKPGQGTQLMILSPTRELSEQIYNVISELSQKMKIKLGLCIGGTSVSQNVQCLLQTKPEVVIGTPGRIQDLISRRALNAKNIKTFVMDEADEMLSHGFKDQVYEIFMELSKEVQVCLFSATLPIEVLELTKKFMRNPVKILVKAEELTLEGIHQFYIDMEQEDYKLDTLVDLWTTLSMTQTIIYVNTKRKCEWLSRRLCEQDYAVSEIHSNLSAHERTEIMNSFKTGATRILITTDLLARGIDVQQVALVVNFDIPFNVETYLHRIGRSGRFGRKGLAINFVTPQEAQLLSDIVKYYSTDIQPMPADIGKFL
jgi:translation initiation factor 4A